MISWAALDVPLVHSTQAALITYRSLHPHFGQGLPVYLRWPWRAASIRGDAIEKLHVFVMVLPL